MPEADLKSAITALLRERGSRVLSIKDIHNRVEPRTGGVDRDAVERAVEELEADGAIVSVRGKRYSLLEFTPYVSGRLKVHPDGYGFVYGRTDEPDIYIERRAMKGAMNGDMVLVRVEKNERNLRRMKGKTFLQGEVTRVLQREHRYVVGRFHDGDPPYIRPFDVRLDEDIDVAPDFTMEARDGEMVYVEIERYAVKAASALARVVEVLGMIGDPGVDIEVVIRKYGIPHEFSEDVIAEAEAVALEVDPEEIAKRVDCRDREIVTIDGETAKDFDDAVEVTKLPNGNYLLGVHIADVSHYVREGSALDREAFERGTSVYFPGRAVPMLPERLSNGICSLNPQVDRLTFSAEIEIDPLGRFVDRRVFKSVIKTRERMTYTDVNAILGAQGSGLGAQEDTADAAPSPETLLARYAALLPLFQRMHELYQILRTRRDARGSIDFDLPEADVLLGEEGEIESIQPSERNVAHRLIEEFMLAANEVIAQELSFNHQPGIYRVHQKPDAQKIEDLKEILKEFKHKLRGDPEEITPGELQRMLKAVAGTPEERFLTELILRAMKRATYVEESTGHFALALQYYCHFTSPIRRYPDLIVHRRLGELLERGAAHGEWREELEKKHPVIAIQASEREKRAEDAEREVLEWKKVIFMRDKVGTTLSGRITGVMPFGLFVELDAYFVQGLVPVSSIGGDFWGYHEREHRLRGQSTGREFRLGDSVMVEVRSIDEDRRQIEFRLTAAGGEGVAPRSRERFRRR